MLKISKTQIDQEHVLLHETLKQVMHTTILCRVLLSNLKAKATLLIDKLLEEFFDRADYSNLTVYVSYIAGTEVRDKLRGLNIHIEEIPPTDMSVIVRTYFIGNTTTQDHIKYHISDDMLYVHCIGGNHLYVECKNFD